MTSRPARSIHLPFVIGVGGLLLGVSVATLLSGSTESGCGRFIVPIVIWVVTAAILILDGRWSRLTPQTIRVALVVVALFAAASHYQFGRFHGERGRTLEGSRFLHYHEFYHYALGSKYFQELEYDGLYCATLEALIENDPSFRDSVQLVKNLHTYQLESRDVCQRRAESIVSRFSKKRWHEFKTDIGYFQSRIPRESWQFVLADHGFNATPFWIFLGSSLVRPLALDDDTLRLLASLDVLLVAAMFLLTWWAFGPTSCLLFAIFFFANFFAAFGITGGAFLRQLWFAGLVGYVCCLRKGKPVAAGVFLVVSVLDRVFPVLFVLLPAVMFLRETVRRRSIRHEPTRCLAAFVVSLVLLGGLSATATGGPGSWRGFYGNIRAHEQWFYTNQISMRNLFLVNPATAATSDPAEWDESLWLRERETRDAQTRNTLRALRVSMFVLLLASMLVSRDALASVALLSFLPFVLLYPANYYYVFLGIVLLCRKHPVGLAVALTSLQAAFWALQAAYPSPLEMEALHWIVSLCLGVTFATFLARELRRSAKETPALRKAIPAVALASAFFLGVGLVADAFFNGGSRGETETDLSTKDVRSVRGAKARSEAMARWGTGWSRNDHVLFLADGLGAEAEVTVSATEAGPHTVRIDYSVTPAFGIVALAVNGREPFPAVNLFSPRVGIVTVVHDGVELRTGRNDFVFTSVGRDPGSSHDHFAIDRIVVSPRRRTQATLENGIAWMLSHPADFFDGGFRGICDEIVTLHVLASTPALESSRSRFVREIEHRLARIDSAPGIRVRPADYDVLAAAAHVARRLGLEFRAFEFVATAAQDRAAADASTRRVIHPLFLCRYLQRLGRADSVPCGIEQSVLSSEHGERRLTPILAGEVDRTTAPAVKSVLLSLTRDVFAITDFGLEAPPRDGIFEDREFWAQLFDRGLAWSMETGDFGGVARLVLAAECLGIAADVPSVEPAVAYLGVRQESDGSFGATHPTGPSPRRKGVLEAILAVAAVESLGHE